MPKKSEMIEGYLKPKKIFIERIYNQVIQGCNLLGIPIHYFKEEEIPALVKAKEMTPLTPVKGTARCVRTYFHHVGIKQPKNVDIPKELRTVEFTGRKFYENMTLGQIRKMPEKERKKFFIKARDIQKAWSGCQASDDSLQNTGLFPDKTPLFCCDYNHTLKPTHTFHIREGKILGTSSLPEELTLVKNIIKTWKTNVHSAYRLDLGCIRVKNKRKTVIVEMNEVWSSGLNITIKPKTEISYGDPNYEEKHTEHANNVYKEAVLVLLARWKDFKPV
jgi:hypothetical protein